VTTRRSISQVTYLLIIIIIVVVTLLTYLLTYMDIIKSAVGCCYLMPGPWVPSQLKNFISTVCEQVALTRPTLCLNKKVYPFFSSCKPIQIIFGRNTAEKIWNKLTCCISDICLLCIASLHRKMTSISISIPKRKILISHFKQFLR